MAQNLRKENRQLLNPDQVLQQRTMEKLHQSVFPKEHIKEDFYYLFEKAMSYNSLGRLKCPIDVFLRICNLKDSIEKDLVSLLEFDMCLTILSHSTPVEMNMSFQGYKTMIKDVYIPMRSVWDSIYHKIQDEIKKDIKSRVVASQGAAIGAPIFKNE